MFFDDIIFNIKDNDNKVLFDHEDGFMYGNMFRNEYDPYKNYRVAKLDSNTEIGKLLLKIYQYDFALNDLSLYLDLHPEDMDVANYWDGLTIAEAKVDVLVQQEKTKMFRQRMEGVEQLLDYLDMRNVPFDDPVREKVFRKYQIMWWEYCAERDKYIRMRDGVDDLADMLNKDRREFENKVAQMREKLED